MCPSGMQSKCTYILLLSRKNTNAKTAFLSQQSKVDVFDHDLQERVVTEFWGAVIAHIHNEYYELRIFLSSLFAHSALGSTCVALVSTLIASSFSPSCTSVLAYNDYTGIGEFTK